MKNYKQIYNNPGPTGVQLNVFLGGDKNNWINTNDLHVGVRLINPYSEISINGPVLHGSGANKILNLLCPDLDVSNCDGNFSSLSAATTYPDLVFDKGGSEYISYADVPSDNQYGYGHPISTFKDVFGIGDWRQFQIHSGSPVLVIVDVFHVELFFSLQEDAFITGKGFSGHTIFGGYSECTFSGYLAFTPNPNTYSYISGIFKLNANLPALAVSTGNNISDIVCGVRYNPQTANIDFFCNGEILVSETPIDNMTDENRGSSFIPQSITVTYDFGLDAQLNDLNNTWLNNKQSQLCKICISASASDTGTTQFLYYKEFDYGTNPTAITSINTYLVKQGCYAAVATGDPFPMYCKFVPIPMFAFPNGEKICDLNVPQYLNREQILAIYEGMYWNTPITTSTPEITLTPSTTVTATPMSSLTVTETPTTTPYVSALVLIANGFHLRAKGRFNQNIDEMNSRIFNNDDVDVNYFGSGYFYKDEEPIIYDLGMMRDLYCVQYTNDTLSNLRVILNNTHCETPVGTLLTEITVPYITYFGSTFDPGTGDTTYIDITIKALVVFEIRVNDTCSQYMVVSSIIPTNISIAEFTPINISNLDSMVTNVINA